MKDTIEDSLLRQNDNGIESSCFTLKQNYECDVKLSENRYMEFGGGGVCSILVLIRLIQL